MQIRPRKVKRREYRETPRPNRDFAGDCGLSLVQVFTFYQFCGSIQQLLWAGLITAEHSWWNSKLRM